MDYTIEEVANENHSRYDRPGYDERYDNDDFYNDAADDLDD